MEALDAELQIDTDLATQSLLLAAANHDIPALRDLLRNSSANVQDPETGYTPLHAAIAAFEPAPEDEPKTAGENGTNGTNGPADATADQQKKEEIDKAVQTIKLLFQNGAIWNDLDANNETPGCIALRLGQKELYELVVDAGVRAELLLGRLDEYQLLGGGDEESEEESEEEDEDEDETNEKAVKPLGDFSITATTTIEQTVETVDPDQPAAAEPPSQSQPPPAKDEEITNPNYLSQPVKFSSDRALDNSDNAVMMSWETPIMSRSASLLLPTPNLRVLNVGHGLGIIDREFQSHSPAAHHIIEAHPDVLARMRTEGWFEKPGVVIHEGRWQDVVPKLIGEGVLFDAIYFDTFAEEYKALREFFTESVIGLLDPSGGEKKEGGKFGFFNGMGADRQVCYDVYTKIVEMDLYEAGFDIEWEDINIPNLAEAGEWKGVTRPYWALDTYRLPTCTFIS